MDEIYLEKVKALLRKLFMFYSSYSDINLKFFNFRKIYRNDVKWMNNVLISH